MFMESYLHIRRHCTLPRYASDHEAAFKRAEELKMDENWKKANCKLCPHCRKVVNKQDGCDHMVCGTDAADKGGGNKQV